MTRRIPCGVSMLVAALAGVAFLAGCSSQPGPEASAKAEAAPAAEATPATTPSTTPANEPAAPGQAAPEAAKPRYIPPVRGVAEIGYLKPVTKVEKDLVITVITVKNLSTGSIAGLKVEEFWWDKAGDPVTGSSDRLKTPLPPGEVVTLTLRTPKNPKMFRNNLRFTHSFGEVKAKLLTAVK